MSKVSIGEHWLEMKTRRRDTARGVSQVHAMDFFFPSRERDVPRAAETWYSQRCRHLPLGATEPRLTSSAPSAIELASWTVQDALRSNCAMTGTCASTRGDGEDRLCQHSVSEQEK